MKKFLTALTLVSVLVLGTSFAGCGCEHVTGEWQIDDNNHYKVCSICGENVDVASHSYEEGECTVCGKLEPIAGSLGLTYSYYDYTNTSYKVTGLGTCEDAVVSIPAEFAGKPVVAIANNAFVRDYHKAENVTKFIIPSSVKEIGAYAFQYRQSEVVFDNPTITEIGKDAFAQFNGPAITIPNTVERICDSAFSLNGNAISYVIPNSVKVIETYAFGNCSKLQSVTFEDNAQVEEIGCNIFNDCENMSTFEIPASVKRLTCHDQYYLNNDNGSFEDAGEMIITFEEGSQLEFIGHYWFLATEGTVFLPEGYTVIDDRALYGTVGANIVVPATVTEIKEGGLSSYDAYYNVFYPQKVFFMGTRTQWEAITVVTTEYAGITYNKSLGELTTVYCAGEWSLVDGVPTPNAN